MHPLFFALPAVVCAGLTWAMAENAIDSLRNRARPGCISVRIDIAGTALLAICAAICTAPVAAWRTTVRPRHPRRTFDLAALAICVILLAAFVWTIHAGPEIEAVRVTAVQR